MSNGVGFIFVSSSSKRTVVSLAGDGSSVNSQSDTLTPYMRIRELMHFPVLHSTAV